MDAIQCFWRSDPVAQKEAYERLAGGAILELDEEALTALFIANVLHQSEYKTNLRYRAKTNPHFPAAIAIVKAIRKKFTLYCVAEKEPPKDMFFRISTGVLHTETEGWHPNYWAHYFSRLLLITTEKIVDTKSRQTFIEVLDFACSEPTTEQLHKRILDDLPVIFFSGYTADGLTSGHSAPILFWGPWLILCDDPDLQGSNTGSFLQFYLYDRHMLTPEALHKVKMASCSNAADFYSYGFREFLQTLQLSKHKKSDQELILEALNSYYPHVNNLCHWYSIESALLAFLLINCEGKVIKPDELTLEMWRTQIIKARALHSEFTFLATLDRLTRYLRDYFHELKFPEVIDVGLDGLWRRWIVAERLSQDPTRWSPDGIWAQKCRQQLHVVFQEVTPNRNTKQFFENALDVQLNAEKSIEEELELVAVKGDWQTLAKWASYGVNLQLCGPSGKSPLEHLFATPSNRVLITVLNQIQTLSSREQQAAAKYLATTLNPCEAHYLISRGISCAEVDEQGFNVVLKMVGAAHPYADSIEHMARLNGDYAALVHAYHYFRLQGICMATGSLKPSCGFVIFAYWIKWFQEHVVHEGCEYAPVVDLTTDRTDKDPMLLVERIKKGALTPLFFLSEGRMIGFVFYQGWLISIDRSITIHKIGQEEEAQSRLKAFIEDPKTQWRQFDNYFDSELLESDALEALASVQALLQDRFILGFLEGIYWAQDASMNAFDQPTTAEQVVLALCSQREKHEKRQLKISHLLMWQYAVQDDLPCKEVHFPVDQELVKKASSKVKNADAFADVFSVLKL